LSQTLELSEYGYSSITLWIVMSKGERCLRGEGVGWGGLDTPNRQPRRQSD